jgi:hypothetical protein
MQQSEAQKADWRRCPSVQPGEPEIVQVRLPDATRGGAVSDWHFPAVTIRIHVHHLADGAKVRQALGPPGGFTGAIQCGEQNADEQRDDADDDE